MTNKLFNEITERKTPYNLGGWHKNQSIETRRKNVLASRTKYQCSYKKYLSAARSLQVLANITRDQLTKKAALSDAKYFFNKSKKHFETK